MRGSVRGCVVFADNLMPVRDAKINVVRGDGVQLKPPPVTDDAGAFRLDELTTGVWWLSAEGPGAESGTAAAFVFDNAVSEVTIEVTDTHPRQAYEGDSLISNGSPAPSDDTAFVKLQGRVVRGTSGTAVAGATVTALEQEFDLQLVVLTDATGQFEFEHVPAGVYVLRVEGRNGDTGTATLRVPDSESSGEITIQIARPRGARRSTTGQANPKGERIMPGTVRGRVERADTGAPVADATIAVIEGAGPAPDMAPLTDVDGRFVMDGLPSGQWIFAAYAADGAQGEATVHVSPGAVADTIIKVS